MQSAAARHKGDQSAIRNQEELDDYIRKIGLVDLQIEAIEADYNVALQQLKNRFLAEQQQVAADRNELLVRVQAYITMHREELLKKDAKTIRLNFGKAGWRKLKDKILGVPKPGTPEMEDLCRRIEIARAMKPADMGRRITVRLMHYVLKHDLTPLTGDELRTIKLTREAGPDEFFVEADREKLRETESMQGESS